MVRKGILNRDLRTRRLGGKKETSSRIKENQQGQFSKKETARLASLKPRGNGDRGRRVITS